MDEIISDDLALPSTYIAKGSDIYTATNTCMLTIYNMTLRQGNGQQEKRIIIRYRNANNRLCEQVWTTRRSNNRTTFNPFRGNNVVYTLSAGDTLKICRHVNPTFEINGNEDVYLEYKVEIIN
ncbi:hypothetical protein [Edaphocola aurantiacus]|uniref:hypothetical protein n=1 Tax=Edaphocola aurantiacus TaxID=2601682 RepID=UPI001C957179|nr:hypothetical protein [Edaphocola aurantiacus]